MLKWFKQKPKVKSYTVSESILSRLLINHPNADQIIKVITASSFDDDTVMKLVDDILANPEQKWEKFVPECDKLTAFKARKIALSDEPTETRYTDQLFSHIKRIANEGKFACVLDGADWSKQMGERDYRIMLRRLQSLGYKVEEKYPDESGNPTDRVAITW